MIITPNFHARRRRSEFWISGNDIEEEGTWEWAKTRVRVPAFGWTEEPFQSPEENCLAWTLFDGGEYFYYHNFLYKAS